MLKVGIIGCGRIAGGFEDDKGRDHPCTHAGSYTLHKRTKIVAISDISQLSLDNFSKRWNVKKTYINYVEMIQREKLDIVSVCTHEDTHVKIIKDVALSGVKLIFCEKPIARNSIETKEMIAVCESNNVELVINHARRWHEHFNYVKSILNNQELGELVSITGRYTSGLMVMGTHMIDTMRFLAGEVDTVIGSTKEDSVDSKPLYSENFSVEDPSYSAMFNFHGGVVGFLDGSCKKQYLLFEIDAHCTSGKVSITSNGRNITIWKNKGGSLKRESINKIQGHTMMMRAVNSIVDIVELGCDNISSGLDGLRVLETIEEVKEKYEQSKTK